jgi:hypothetical protein
MAGEYLRIEGVNLAGVMDDTAQLSVVRGASFLLRDAVKGIAKDFACCLDALRTGASVGLFRVKDGDAKILRALIVDRLNGDRQFQHLTFVVDIQPDADDLTRTVEALTARNRFRQMRQLSVALPPCNDGNAKPCTWDDLRPRGIVARDGVVEVRRDKGVEFHEVSHSVKERHDYGRSRKRLFYDDETKTDGESNSVIAGLKYTNELDEIATESPQFRDLENKIAVIYFDGNDFGKIARMAGLREFDEKLRGYQSDFLRDLLLEIADDDDFRFGDRLRLETLLWGGDEMIFVMPAWKGFWALNWFYEKSAGWDYNKDKLTHSGGLVFCHYKTPIHRIRKLAEDLAGKVKVYLKGQTKEVDQRQNRFEYAVLESIDFPTEPLGQFWQKRYRALADCRRPLPPISNWDQARRELGKLLKDRKGQVQSLVEAGRQDPGRGFEVQRRRFTEVVGTAGFTTLKERVESLFPEQGCEVWPWIHLLELWDYLVLDDDPENGGPDGGAT